MNELVHGAGVEIAMFAVAILIDISLGELPTPIHPVVWIGNLIGFLRRFDGGGPRRQFLVGVGLITINVVVVAVPTFALMWYLRQASLPLYFVVGTYLLTASFSVRGLLTAANQVRRPLEAGRLDQARRGLGSLVSRDTSALDEPLLVAATVESVAENSSDSFVAPLFYFLLFGVPGALVYRAINTADSMVGYHGRYEYLGKAAARLDDAANFIPARITGLLMVVASALRCRAAESWRVAWAFHGVTESPNAGWPMSAMAGALAVRLEKVGHYQIGDGHSPLTAGKIGDANWLAGATMALTAVVTIVLLVVKYGYFS
jgi:adenosylcobinamide-phosphate synthase